MVVDYKLDYPRTLIIGLQFSEQSGGGIFLGRLFSGWPNNCLATVSSDNLLPDKQRCRLQYRIGHLEYRLYAPFKWIVSQRTSSDHHISVSSVYGHEVIIGKSSFSVRGFAQYLWRAFLDNLGGGEILYKVAPSSKLISWVHKFKPEVLYGVCSDLNSVRFLRQIQQVFGLPLVLHFMDDWPENLYRQSFISRLVRKSYLKEFSKLVQSADVAIAISKEMADEYEKRYKRQVLTLPMPADLDVYKAVARSQWLEGRPFRLRYGGRVGWAIQESLSDIARAVHSLRKMGADVTFDLATFQKDQVPSVCNALSGVNIQIPGPLADLPYLQTESDVLVICYDFDARSFSQARYSMPSKLADCMASGTPILVYGPPGLPVVEYARREGWGMVVDSRDIDVLRLAISELMASSDLREKFGKKSKKCAAKMHDAKIVSESFRALLQELVEKE